MTKAQINKIKKFSEELEVCYKLFNWTWQNNDEPPTAAQIAKTIKALIKDIGESAYVTTGGLTVMKTEDGFTVTWAPELNLWI